ncbi:MAG TPA: DoxX family protein [Bacillales bacterium]
MAVFSIVLHTFLVLYFVFTGVSKMMGAKYWMDMFNHLDLPQWFRVFTGIVQLIGAAGLIIGYWFAEAAAWGAIWLEMTMLLACVAHFRIKDSIAKTWPAFMFVVMILALIIINKNDFLHLFSWEGLYHH